MFIRIYICWLQWQWIGLKFYYQFGSLVQNVLYVYSIYVPENFERYTWMDWLVSKLLLGNRNVTSVIMFRCRNTLMFQTNRTGTMCMNMYQLKLIVRPKFKKEKTKKKKKMVKMMLWLSLKKILVDEMFSSNCLHSRILLNILLKIIFIFRRRLLWTGTKNRRTKSQWSLFCSKVCAEDSWRGRLGPGVCRTWDSGDFMFCWKSWSHEIMKFVYKLGKHNTSGRKLKYNYLEHRSS